MTKPELPQTTRDPEGRTVAFTDWTWEHAIAERPELNEDVVGILDAVANPDHREDDPIKGRERFYQRRVTDKARWLRVVVDFNEDPALVVTAFIQRKDPT